MRFETKTLALGLAAMILLIGVGRRAEAYEYVPTSDSGAYEDYTEEDYSDTHWSDGMASADANGCCSATTHAYADANDGDSAWGGATAAAFRRTDWDWDGPPGTAPGGHLTWSIDSSGSAFVTGGNSSPSDSGSSSSASAGSGTSADSSGSSADAYGNAGGSVTGSKEASGSATYGGSPEPYYHWPYEELHSGGYLCSIEWASYAGGSVNIPSGTTHIYFRGDAGCTSYASACGTLSTSSAYSFASTLAGADASFTSN